MAASDVRVSISRIINAPAGTVYDAWVEPALMERWLFKSESNRLTAQTDPRPGGAYSIVEQSNGDVITHDGNYAIAQRPKRLVFSLIVPQHFSGVAEIEVVISPNGTTSQLDFIARGAGPDDAQRIWERMLCNLARLVEPT